MNIHPPINALVSPLYERLKPYFQTSAQEISAILEYFPILKQQ